MRNRYVLVGRRRDHAHPWLYYITANGCITCNADKAYPIVGATEAKCEWTYWNRSQSVYEFSVEQLPPRKPMRTAVLHSIPVEL